MFGYGHKKFFENIEEMEIQVPTIMKFYWLITLKVITPLILLFVLIMSFVQYAPAYSPSFTQENYVFPDSIQFLGWFIGFFSVGLIIVGVLTNIFNRKQENKSVNLRSMLTPSIKWGPALVITSEERKEGQDNHTFITD